MEIKAMMPRLGEVIAQARRARRPTLRQLANQVTKEDGSPISPQYLNDIELHHHIPTPHLLREFAWVLALEYERLLTLAGAADTVVREYVAAYPPHAEVVRAVFQALITTGTPTRAARWLRDRGIIFPDFSPKVSQ
jgi:transcriptional regulator with XRE-family HTH domain